jgi:hypothetical protein
MNQEIQDSFYEALLLGALALVIRFMTGNHKPATSRRVAKFIVAYTILMALVRQARPQLVPILIGSIVTSLDIGDIL